MKPSPLPPSICAAGRRTGAFTLIELIAVMAIILILAGLILGIAGHAQHDSSVRRAQTEIKAMEAAIEAYKIDNGNYPEGPITSNSTTQTATDSLNPYTDFDPGPNTSTGAKYQKANEYLYQCLSGNVPVSSGGTGNLTKPYFDFKPGQLAVANDASGITTPTPTSPYMYIVDPFGYYYGYSTSNQYAASTATAGATPSGTQAGYNPTFDLWSTAGYSAAAGHGTPSNMAAASPAVAYSLLWVKNW